MDFVKQLYSSTFLSTADESGLDGNDTEPGRDKQAVIRHSGNGKRLGNRQTTTVTNRLVAPAVTPIYFRDLLYGLRRQARGSGRDEFANTIRRYLGGNSVGTYTSYRRALCDCMRTLAQNRPEHDRNRSSVAVPAFRSSDYDSAIEAAGFETIAYDVDSETLGGDPTAIESLPWEELFALVVISPLGYPSHLDQLASLCDEHDVRLVEALGYSIGSRYDGQLLGTFGDCSVLNFQQGKPIPVGGGMVVSRDSTLGFDDFGREPVSPNVAMLTGYSLFARPRAYWLYQELKEFRNDGQGRVTTHPESKGRVDYKDSFKTLSDFQGAVAIRVFERLGKSRRRREATARFYGSQLKEIEGLKIPTPVEKVTDHQYVRFPVLIESKSMRDRLKQNLNDAGIHATTLYDWPPLDQEQYPGAERIQRTILTLPTHPYVSRRDRQRVVSVVRTTMESPGRRNE